MWVKEMALGEGDSYSNRREDFINFDRGGNTALKEKV